MLKGVPESAKNFVSYPLPCFTISFITLSPNAVVVPSCASSTTTKSQLVSNISLFLSKFPPTLF